VIALFLLGVFRLMTWVEFALLITAFYYVVIVAAAVYHSIKEF